MDSENSYDKEKIEVQQPDVKKQGRRRRRILYAVAFVLCIVIVNTVLGFALIKPGLTRIMLHELDEGDYQCVVLGTSHGSYGIDADTVSETSGKKTMNLCIGGEYMQDSYYLLKRAIRKNQNLDTVVLDVDYQYLVNVPKDSVSANFIYNAYPLSTDKLSYFTDKVMRMEYRATLFPWMDYRDRYCQIIKTVKTKRKSAYRACLASTVEMDPSDTYEGKGFISRNRNCTTKTDTLRNITWDESKVDADSIRYFRKIVKLCKKKNIKVVMTTVPVTPEKIATSQETYDEIHNYIQSLADASDCQYIDFNRTATDEFTPKSEDYWDYDGHMYGDSAKRFSKIYGEYISRAVSGIQS